MTSEAPWFLTDAKAVASRELDFEAESPFACGATAHVEATHEMRETAASRIAGIAGIPGETDEAPAGGDAPRLGVVSEKYESRGDPAAVSTGAGDAGGASYGLYQLTSKNRDGSPGGRVAEYVAQSRYRVEFAGKTPGTPAFTAAWKAIAAREPAAFGSDQWAFIKATHYDPMAAHLRAALGLDVDRRSNALRQVIWSTAVQHGPTNAIVDRALAGRMAASVDDSALIPAIYAERGRRDPETGEAVWFKRNSRAVQDQQPIRFTREQARALDMLAREPQPAHELFPPFGFEQLAFEAAQPREGELYAGPPPSPLAESWRSEAEQLIPPQPSAATSIPAVRGDARYRTTPPTVPGTTLDVAQTRAQLGDAGTSYNRGTPALVASIVSGDRNAHEFWCSGLSLWTLAASGYDLTKPLVGGDGQPYTWNDGKTEVRVTLKAIIDGEPEAVEAMTLAQQRKMASGGSVGRLSGAGHSIGHGPDGDALAVKGAAGAFRIAGIGADVPELEQKPGDFAQARWLSAGIGSDTSKKHWGAGHAWQVWSVRVKGSAVFGKPGSPTPTESEALAGWRDGVEFTIDKDTNPALVGPHTVLAARRIEANVPGAGTLSSSGDGGVQITREKAVPDHGRSTNPGFVVYYGRLGTSPWTGWQPAVKPA